MPYELSLKDFEESLNIKIEQAENHRFSYTPNNREQIYKHNNLECLFEIRGIVEYFKGYHNLDDEQILNCIFERVKQLYLDESERLKTMSEVNLKLRIGIIDTYHFVADKLFYFNSIQRYLYQRGRYSKVKEELLIS